VCFYVTSICLIGVCGGVQAKTDEFHTGQILNQLIDTTARENKRIARAEHALLEEFADSRFVAVDRFAHLIEDEAGLRKLGNELAEASHYRLVTRITQTVM